MPSTRLSPYLALLVCLAACSSSGSSPQPQSCAHDTDCSSSTGFCDPGSSTCSQRALDFLLSDMTATAQGLQVTFELELLGAGAVTRVQMLLDGVNVGEARPMLGTGSLPWTFLLEGDLPKGAHYLRALAQMDGRSVYSTEWKWLVCSRPNLISQSPASGATDVPVTSPVVLTFDEPVSLEDGTSIAFWSAGAFIPAVVSWSDDARTLTAVCQHPERLGHTATLDYSVTDQLGCFPDGGSVSYGIEAPQVVLTSPTVPVTTSGTQAFYATVTGSPEKVEVLADDGVHLEGVVLGTMSVNGLMGSFYWDTTTVGPGTYPIWLRAVRGDWAVTSAAVDVTVTR